jgi:hypothetical protein
MKSQHVSRLLEEQRIVELSGARAKIRPGSLQKLLPNNISDKERGAGGFGGGACWRAAPCVGGSGCGRGARGAGAGRMSTAGGSGWSCSAVGATGFGLATIGVRAGRDRDVSGSVCAAFGAVDSIAGALWLGSASAAVPSLTGGARVGGAEADGAAGDGAAATGGSRPSRTSSFFDCCSTARSASQLASIATSTVRLAVSTGPFNPTTTSGRVFAGAPAPPAPNRVNRPSMLPSAKSMLPLKARSAPCARTIVLLSRAWPALMAIVPSASATARLPPASAASILSRTRVVSIGKP